MDDAGPRYTFTLKPGLKLQVLLTAIFSLLFSNLSLALDCVPDHFTLTSQAQVDSFVANYGTCDHIVGVMNIYSGPFTDLDGLKNIVSVGDSLIIGKYEQARLNIASLSGLESLQTVTNEFAIQTTSTLSSLAPLSSLTTVGTLTIRDLTAISSLDGLGNISGDLVSLQISGLPLLTNLNGLPGSLDSVNTFQIYGNDSLEILDGLPAMSDVTGFGIGGNLALENINALAAINFRSFGVPFESPSIAIADNPLLGSLSGIPPVTALSFLAIGGNTSITDLDVLDGLLEVWGLVSVRENTNLSDCSVLTKVLDDVDDGFPGPNDSNPDFPPDVDWNAQSDEGMLGLNAPGCNTIEQIVGTGSGEEVFIDGFEGN